MVNFTLHFTETWWFQFHIITNFPCLCLHMPYLAQSLYYTLRLASFTRVLFWGLCATTLQKQGYVMDSWNCPWESSTLDTVNMKCPLSMIRHFPHSWLVAKFNFFFKISRGFHDAFVVGMTCLQGTLASLDAWFRPILGLCICSCCWNQSFPSCFFRFEFRTFLDASIAHNFPVIP